ncbi:MAG TPA: DUF1015 domain-containing protein [Gemmatimonadales bacterium]|nr:DUF1015 domain-containing protein [Gemmatimonadales bacterium]
MSGSGRVPLLTRIGSRSIRFRPFRAWRPQPSIAPGVASPPYDVVTRDEAAALAVGYPLSFLHVVRSDIDLPPGTDPHDPAVYAKARENLDLLMGEGSFVQEKTPAIFLLQMTSGRRSQIGVVGCLHVDDYARNIVRKHENTRKDKEDDRTRHILALNAQAEPVLLAHEPSPFIVQLNTRVMNQPPLFDFTVDEVRQRVWRAPDPAAYVDAFRRISTAYIADGHHRTAGAWRAATELRAKHPEHSGNEEYNWFLGVLFPSSSLRILPYHRAVRDLNGMTPESFLGRLAALGKVFTTDTPAPRRSGSFGILVGGRWYRLELERDSIDTVDPVRSLDASLLQARILEPMLGIGDVRSDARIAFVGGGKGIPELERLVASGEMAVAFAMCAVTMEQLIKVADAGGIMPPKSTWFEPKLRSGLFVHSLA